MKKKLLFLTISFLLTIVSIIGYSCVKDNETSINNEANINNKKEINVFPRYSDIYAEKISSRTDQNCCECHNNGCSAKKCCSAPETCSCTCSDSVIHSQCSCNSCTGNSQHISHELWLTPTQFEFWEDWSNILEADPSDAAESAVDEILNVLDAVVEDDFEKFQSSKENLWAHCLLLSSSTTKSSINTLLAANNFVDELE